MVLGFFFCLTKCLLGVNRAQRQGTNSKLYRYMKGNYFDSNAIFRAKVDV